MPNHFHFLLKTKPKEVFLTFPKFETLEKFSTKEEHYQLGKFISRQLGNLFSSYTQSFNKMYDRKGSLFIKNCKHKELKNEKYFNNIVHYIHANPVLHGFVKNIEDWKWSSYQSIISLKKSHLQRETVITWFGDAKQYLTFHQKEIDRRLIAEFES